MNNDNKIMEFKKKLDKMRDELVEPNRNKKKTSLQQTLFANMPKNINVFSLNQLMVYKAMVKSLIAHCDEDEIITNDCGYNYTDVLHDVSNIIKEKKYKDKLREINVAEKKLEALLSEQAKTSMEIGNIMNDLGVKI